MTPVQRSPVSAGYMCTNSWWVTVNKLVFWRRFKAEVGHGWTPKGLSAALWQHQQQKCGEVSFAVFHAPPVWHKPVFPLLCLPGSLMFLWQTASLQLEGRLHETTWQTKRQRDRQIERETEGEEKFGAVERGSLASLCQGFPRHLGCVNLRLAQAHS